MKDTIIRLKFYINHFLLKISCVFTYKYQIKLALRSLDHVIVVVDMHNKNHIKNEGIV